mmetsp:Transcript_21843/g.36154  ORF Transcript_21843/g.36154 Transcript_21843/m.36154 type:complete len:629 (+) Transcript_21843:249-2135(+)
MAPDYSNNAAGLSAGFAGPQANMPWFQEALWPFRQRTLNDRKKDLPFLKNPGQSQSTVLDLLSTRFIKSVFSRSVRVATNTITRTSAKRNIKVLMRSSSDVTASGTQRTNRSSSRTMPSDECSDENHVVAYDLKDVEEPRELVLQSDQLVTPKVPISAPVTSSGTSSSTGSMTTTSTTLTEQQLCAVFARSSKVHTVQLCSCNSVTDETLSSFSSIPHARLTNVVIKSCEKISAPSMTRLFLNTPNLLLLHLEHLTCLNPCFDSIPPSVRILRVSFCIGFDDKCLLAIARRCKDLQELRLVDVPLVTSTGIMAVAGRALQTLKITHANRVTDEALLEVAKNCPRLAHLELSRGPGYQPSTVSLLFQRCPRMQYFALENCNMTGVIDLGVVSPSLHHLSFMANARLAAVRGRGGDLQTLNLSYCKRLLADCVFGIQFELTNLRELDVSSCKLYDFDLLLLIRRAPQLTKLMMGGSNVSDACIRLVLRSCPQLLELNLVECNLLTDVALSYISEEKTKNSIPLRLLHLTEPIKVFPHPSPFPEALPPSIATTSRAPPMSVIERSLSDRGPSVNYPTGNVISLGRSVSMLTTSTGGMGHISDVAVDGVRQSCKGMFICCQSRLKRPRTWAA